MYERIRALREDKDLTQQEMGQILMCSQRIYSNYERGDVDIPTTVLIRLADFHGVSVDYLLNRTDNPKNEHVTQITEEYKKTSRSGNRLSPSLPLSCPAR